MEKTFDAATAEARILQKWLESNAFRAGANAKPNAPPFSIMIPPPNVTGSLHMGHAFNNTLQDILVRWHRMQGYDTLWQPGTDHAGIATQMVTEREMAANGEPTRREMGRQEFIERVWQQKQQSRGTIIGQLMRLGASCDWSREAFTMSGAPSAPKGEEGNFHDAVIKVFVDMYNKGLIYRGKRLVNWDPLFETAISDLEVEQTEVDGHMWHFKYPLAGGETYTYRETDKNGNVTLEETRDYISIATTRPETMLGDGAVAVHPSDSRYAPIIGKLCEIPVGPKEQRRLIPIITDEYPDPDFGSGAVKITGAHDFNDYGVTKRNHLPLYRLMDERAHMREDGLSYEESAQIAAGLARGEKALNTVDEDQINLVPTHLRGLDRYEARQRVIDEITREGLAVMTRADDARLGKAALKPGSEEANRPTPLVEAKKIMQPFGDRSKVVIEPMLTDQWFVDTAKIVEPALRTVREGRVKIIPQSGEKVYYHWLENIEPWCISRQLWWGHQIPIWYDDQGNSYCATTKEEALKQAGGRALRRDCDVLDTWFSSGLWPIGTLGWPEQTPELKKYFPTSVLVTGQDILFFWVSRMMMMQLAVVNDIPFHTVYLHGLVRDAKGKKMSKSLGNVIDPIDIIDEYGADALRFANASMASLGSVLKLDTQRIMGYRNFGTKLWNACRFAEMNNVWAEHKTQSAPPEAHATVNCWIISETNKVIDEVTTALQEYRFDYAAHALYSFIWGKVCDWYVEFSKPLFDGEYAAETRITMAWVLDQSMILLHPFMPFITEELWSTTAQREKMLVHTSWPEPSSLSAHQHMAQEQAMQEMTWVIGVIDAIRSARSQVRVPAGAKLHMIITSMTGFTQNAWSRNEILIKRLARIESVKHQKDTPKGAITVAVEGASFAIPLEGVIDIHAEKARLEKAFEKLSKEVSALEGRLSNKKFIASAPEDIVEEARNNLAVRKEEADKISKALERLIEIA